MLAIESAREFYGDAPDGYPEWDDLTEEEQNANLAQYVSEGKITLCGFEYPAWRNFPSMFCDNEANHDTELCDMHEDYMKEVRS